MGDKEEHFTITTECPFCGRVIMVEHVSRAMRKEHGDENFLQAMVHNHISEECPSDDFYVGVAKEMKREGQKGIIELPCHIHGIAFFEYND